MAHLKRSDRSTDLECDGEDAERQLGDAGQDQQEHVQAHLLAAAKSTMRKAEQISNNEQCRNASKTKRQLERQINRVLLEAGFTCTASSPHRAQPDRRRVAPARPKHSHRQ